MDPRDIRLRFENPVLEDEPWDIRMRLDVVQVQTPRRVENYCLV